MRKNWEYRRGDVYLADLDPVVGAEIGGVRPVPVSYTHLVRVTYYGIQIKRLSL